MAHSNTSKTAPTPKHDSEREIKWSAPRIMYTDTQPWKDPGIDFSDAPSMTDQSQAADCDVNNILKRFAQTGILPGTNIERVYADVSDSLTYHDAMNIVANANTQFDSLDAYTRQRFHNDPAEFLDFVHDPKNVQELVDLGLATATPTSDTDRLINEMRASNAPSPASPDPSEPPAVEGRSASNTRKQK